MIRYIGVAGVASWFGVSPQTVTKWLDRYAESHPTPEPDAMVGDVKGWLPEREEEWRKWADARPGQAWAAGKKLKS